MTNLNMKRVVFLGTKDLKPRLNSRFEFYVGDHSFKTSACPRGEGCPQVPMVQRSQYIRIKNPLHKHFAGMPMVVVKNREKLPTS